MSARPGPADNSPTSLTSSEHSDAKQDGSQNSSKSLETQGKDDFAREGSLDTVVSSEGSQTPLGRHRQRGLAIETNVQASTALPQIDETEQAEAAKEKPISWRSLPRKDQLFVLTTARLSEPLTQTSLGAYLFYQLQSFDPSLPDSTISYQAGIIHAAFPAAQFLTAILWGRFADSEHGGRKRVIWIGLLGTMFSMLGFGFSHSFPVAVFFRCLGGVLNGNIGVMRTMISEIIKEKKYQSRAFIILPMTFNIGVIIGPILGGLLADPVGSYPSIFGPDSLIGGRDGVQWMMKWPYALPNIMSAIFLFISTCSVHLFLEETSELCKHKPDYGLRAGRWARRHLFRQNISPEEGYAAIPTDEWAAATSSVELSRTPTSANHHHHHHPHPWDKPAPTQKLPFRRIWTRNLIATMASHAMLAMHVGTFNSLWFTYLSTPRWDPTHPYPPNYTPHGPLHFTGGLALPPPRIGLALSILGIIGITLQLLVYPRLSHRLGPTRSYRIFLALFPLTYTLVPFLSIVPSRTAPPAPVEGPLVWSAITGVLCVQVLARTFALPCAAILINNCCPHPSVLGTVHGLGQSVGSLTRTVGPVFGGWLFGRGLDGGVVGLAWWVLAVGAVGGCFVSLGVREGDGHEVLLEGEVRGVDGVVRVVRV